MQMSRVLCETDCLFSCYDASQAVSLHCRRWRDCWKGKQVSQALDGLVRRERRCPYSRVDISDLQTSEGTCLPAALIAVDQYRLPATFASSFSQFDDAAVVGNNAFTMLYAKSDYIETVSLRIVIPANCMRASNRVADELALCFYRTQATRSPGNAPSRVVRT